MTKNSAEESRDSNDGINENVEEVRELSMVRSTFNCFDCSLLFLFSVPDRVPSHRTTDSRALPAPLQVPSHPPSVQSGNGPRRLPHWLLPDGAGSGGGQERWGALLYLFPKVAINWTNIDVQYLTFTSLVWVKIVSISGESHDQTQFRWRFSH